MPQPLSEEQTPAAEDQHIDTIAIERSEGVLNRLFGDDVHEKEGVVADKKEVPEDTEDVEDDTEDVVEDNVEDSEEDWDASKKEEKSDEDPKDESAARKQAKLKGREAKQLKTELTESKLETDRITKERDELRSRLDEVEATKLKPEDHPDYVDAREGILKDARAVARRFTGKGKTLLLPAFGNLMAEYLRAGEADDVVDADNKLNASIATALELSDVPYADMDEDEQEALRPQIDKVLDLLERNAGKTTDLQKLHANLLDKAKTGHLSVGVRTYENTIKEFKPILDSVGDLADDLIEANPHAIESVVAKMAKASPEAAKRLDKARADVMEVLVGPRALTQKEIDKLEDNGTDVKAFLVERSKAHRVKQQKLAAFFVQGLVTRSVFKETLAKLAKYETEEESEESEFDAIRKSTKKRTDTKDKYVRPKDRASSVNKLFGGEE